jgi:hypothetical protein
MLILWLNIPGHAERARKDHGVSLYIECQWAFIDERQLYSIAALPDSHPRVRYAAFQRRLRIQSQGKYLFFHIYLLLTDHSLSLLCRVHSHAATALINFCEGVDSERDMLLPYLDPIVEPFLG